MSSIISSPKVEQPMSIDKWMDKQNMAHPFCGYCPALKGKETDVCYDP